MKKLFFCFLFSFLTFWVTGCDMDSDSDYGELTSTYTSDDCTIRTYRKEHWLTGEVTITTVSDCYGDREVDQLVIH